MKRAQYRDTPPQNIYSHIDHKWGYDGSGLRVEQSFRREFATIIPLEGATRRRFKRFVRLPVLRLVWNKLEDM